MYSNLIETRHPMSVADRSAAQALLAANARHFATFAGTMRDAYDAMTAQTPVAPHVAAHEVNDGAVRGWWLRPQGAPDGRAILFLHGGAYLFGSAHGYRGFASQVAARTGVATFVPDYPLAPDHPFPAAVDAVSATLAWLGTHGIGDVALVGDSAGGALALGALAQPAAAAPAIAAVVVFSPWIDLTLSGASMAAPDTVDPVFQRAVLANAAATYLAGAPPDDGRASPLFALPPRLPPLAIQVGTDELLLDDARRYAFAAAARGDVVQLDIYEGMHHVFQRSTRELASARAALDGAARFIDAHWPTAA
jgi:monoterpene epsilon-lactone hydrolase